jgi:probable HAF family extracellular repeat protein
VNGQPTKLPTLGGKGWNTPMAVSNSGLIVGFSDTPGDVSGGVLTANNQAVLWTREGIVNLHTLPGDATAQATGVNDFGQIIGTSFAANGNTRVFLYEHGRMYDLNTLVQPNAPLYLLGTGDIDDRGEITGYACVVVNGACGNLVHTFVAIVAPGGGADDREQNRQSQQSRHVMAQPAVSDELRERVGRLQRFGHVKPEREPAQ